MYNMYVVYRFVPVIEIRMLFCQCLNDVKNMLFSKNRKLSQKYRKCEVYTCFRNNIYCSKTPLLFIHFSIIRKIARAIFSSAISRTATLSPALITLGMI